MSGTIHVDMRDGVTWITLNRPERLNAMNAELIDAVLEALDSAARDDAVRVVVLTGAGRGFCSGGDLREEVVQDTPFDARIQDLRRQTRSSELLHSMDKITIAAVNGPCAGAGLSWACAADLRFAARSAVFKTSFLSAGMSGDFGGTWSLTNIVGPARARELYLLDRKLSAADACALGLVSEVFDDESLLERVDDIARQLVSRSPLALREMKRNLNDAFSLNFSESLDVEGARHMRTAFSTERKEAVASTSEKSPPASGSE